MGPVDAVSIRLGGPHEIRPGQIGLEHGRRPRDVGHGNSCVLLEDLSSRVDVAPGFRVLQCSGNRGTAIGRFVLENFRVPF